MMKINFDDSTLIKMLQERIPEISDMIFPEFEFSAYINYGIFGSFLRDKIREESSNLELIQRSFLFLNFLIENGDENILRMIRVETFEMLTDYDETIETTKKYLKGDALQIFFDVVKVLK